MNPVATIARSLQADMRAVLRNLIRATAAGTKEAGRSLKTELRGRVTSARLGQRLTRTWRDRHYDRGFDTASVVYTNAPQIICAVERNGALPEKIPLSPLLRALGSVRIHASFLLTEFTLIYE